MTDGQNWNLIGKKSPKEPQMFYPINDSSMTITKGDILAARCTMVKTFFTPKMFETPKNISFQVNHNEHDVYIGQTNKDEMCNFYIMYWVLGKEPVDKRVCFSQGPPFWSWKANAQLKNIPDEAASTLP